MAAFRSPVIAVKAIVLNLLSVAAACGVLVLVFQHGYGSDFLGFTPTSGIDPVVPLLLFVILFGLSMDYHVFLLSRIREAVQRARPPKRPSRGASSRRPVSSPARPSSWSGVFAVFATLSMLMFKQFGVGLATAILIDATIVRGVLLPASMKLLGIGTGTCRGGSSGCPGSTCRGRASARDRGDACRRPGGDGRHFAAPEQAVARPPGIRCACWRPACSAS